MNPKILYLVTIPYQNVTFKKNVDFLYFLIVQVVPRSFLYNIWSRESQQTYSFLIIVKVGLAKREKKF